MPGFGGCPESTGTYPIYPRQISAPPTSTGPVLSRGCWNQIISGFSEGEERRRKPAAHAHPPALGADAAGPACYDTVHMRVVSVVPSTVFGADLGEKEKQMGRGHFPHTPNSWPIGDQHRSKTRIETSR